MEAIKTSLLKMTGFCIGTRTAVTSYGVPMLTTYTTGSNNMSILSDVSNFHLCILKWPTTSNIGNCYIWSQSTSHTYIKPYKEKDCTVIKDRTIHKCDILRHSFFYVDLDFKSYSKIHGKYANFTPRDMLRNYFCVIWSHVFLSASPNLIIFYYLLHLALLMAMFRYLLS